MAPDNTYFNPSKFKQIYEIERIHKFKLPSNQVEK